MHAAWEFGLDSEILAISMLNHQVDISLLTTQLTCTSAEWRTQLQPVVVVVDAEVSEIADVVAVDAVVVAADPVAADAERRERR